MGFSGIMEQKIQMKNMVRNYNPNSGTDRRRTSCFCLLTVLWERFHGLTAADRRMETRIKLSFAHRLGTSVPTSGMKRFQSCKARGN